MGIIDKYSLIELRSYGVKDLGSLDLHIINDAHYNLVTMAPRRMEGPHQRPLVDTRANSSSLKQVFFCALWQHKPRFMPLSKLGTLEIVRATN